MKLIKGIVRPNKVDDIKDALAKYNILGMTVTEVRGHGRQKGHSAVYRGKEYEVSLLPKMEVDVVVPDEVVDEVIQAIITAAADRGNRRWPRLRHPGRAGLHHSDRGKRCGLISGIDYVENVRSFGMTW